MSSRYEQMKAHPDWLDLATEGIKQQMRVYTLDSVLARKPYATIADRIKKAIEELCVEIEDEEIKERTRAELSAFADASYKQAANMLGYLTAHQFAIILSRKQITTAQQETIVKTAQASPSIQEAVSNIPEPPRQAYNRSTPNATYYRDVQKSILEQMKDYESLTAGKQYVINVNPRNIAEMAVRFRKYQEDRKRLVEKGVKLVIVPARSTCSPRCRPYQGRIYSLDGTSGTENGYKYVPLEEAADNVTYTSPKTGRTYFAGLFSYNCNHQIQEYTGQRIVKIPDKVVKETYEIQQTQRRMERDVRRLKEKEQIYRTIYRRSKNEDMRKIAQKAGEEASKKAEQYKSYSRKMHAPMYAERLRIAVGENIYARTSKDKNAQKTRL